MPVLNRHAGAANAMSTERMMHCSNPLPYILMKDSHEISDEALSSVRLPIYHLLPELFVLHVALHSHPISMYIVP